MTDRKTVLLVDDDSDFILANKQLLEAAGYDVCTAYTGAEGLEKAKAVHPNLILLDVMMESENAGFVMNEALREIPDLEDVPVIMLTGVNQDLDRPYHFDVCNGWPCAAFLEKPVRPEILLREVRAWAR